MILGIDAILDMENRFERHGDLTCTSSSQGDETT
jgi:hypothetical protein